LEAIAAVAVVDRPTGTTVAPLCESASRDGPDARTRPGDDHGFSVHVLLHDLPAV
jgi:hypothetical protein